MRTGLQAGGMHTRQQRTTETVLLVVQQEQDEVHRPLPMHWLTCRTCLLQAHSAASLMFALPSRSQQQHLDLCL